MITGLRGIIVGLDEAKATLEKALELNPVSPEARELLGRISGPVR